LWWLGLYPNHHIYSSLLRAWGFFITLLQAEPKRGAAHGVQKAPALVVPAQADDGRWEDYGVVFYGIPPGYECTSPITSLLLVSSSDSGLSAESRETMASLKKDIDVQVFVTPTCPYCPRAVTLAHPMAIESPRVRAAMVEVTEFPEESMKHGISGVPHSVINHQVRVVGAVPAAHLLEEIQRAAHQFPLAG